MALTSQEAGYIIVLLIVISVLPISSTLSNTLLHHSWKIVRKEFHPEDMAIKRSHCSDNEKNKLKQQTVRNLPAKKDLKYYCISIIPISISIPIHLNKYY